MKTLSDNGLAALVGFEGCKLNAYRDSGGLPTIGVGHIRGVKMGDQITQKQADAFLREDLVRFEKCVNGVVIAAINQNQYDALVCWTFNLGCGALKGSTLLRVLNALDYAEAAKQILRWNKVGKKWNKGLANRREAERKMFLTSVKVVTPKVEKAEPLKESG